MLGHHFRLLTCKPMKYGHSTIAKKPFQKLRCRYPMVKSQEAHHRPPAKLCCSMRIFGACFVQESVSKISLPWCCFRV